VGDASPGARQLLEEIAELKEEEKPTEQKEPLGTESSERKMENQQEAEIEGQSVQNDWTTEAEDGTGIHGDDDIEDTVEEPGTRGEDSELPSAAEEPGLAEKYLALVPPCALCSDCALCAGAGAGLCPGGAGLGAGCDPAPGRGGGIGGKFVRVELAGSAELLQSDCPSKRFSNVFRPMPHLVLACGCAASR
jgi:hypothetical protein